MLKLFLEVVPITCLVGLIYAIYRYIKIKRQALSVKWGEEIIRWLFVCYLTGLVNLVLTPPNLWSHFWFYVRNGYGTGDDFFRGWFSGGFNFVPTLYKCLVGEFTLGSWVRQMLAGNILMLVPMGFFLPLVSEKVNKRSILVFAITIPAAVELIQPIVGRSFDIDDLLCNFIGIVFGYGIAAGMMHFIHKKRLRA